jgi:hypothetical protein
MACFKSLCSATWTYLGRADMISSTDLRMHIYIYIYINTHIYNYMHRHIHTHSITYAYANVICDDSMIPWTLLYLEHFFACNKRRPFLNKHRGHDSCAHCNSLVWVNACDRLLTCPQMYVSSHSFTHLLFVQVIVVAYCHRHTHADKQTCVIRHKLHTSMQACTHACMQMCVSVCHVWEQQTQTGREETNTHALAYQCHLMMLKKHWCSCPTQVYVYRSMYIQIYAQARMLYKAWSWLNANTTGLVFSTVKEILEKLAYFGYAGWTSNQNDFMHLCVCIHVNVS